MDELAHDVVALRSYWGSALVAYRRAFNDGKGFGSVPRRAKLRVPPELVEALDPGLKSVHEESLENANRHIAHRVNDLSQVKVEIVNDPRGNGKVGVVILSAFQLGPGPGQALQLSILAGTLESSIGAQVKKRHHELLTEANGGPPPSQDA
jgi:hypothetical protein